MIIIKSIAWLISAAMFIVSSGQLFRDRFRDHRLLVLVTAGIAIVSTYLLVEELWRRYGDEAGPYWHMVEESAGSYWRNFVSGLPSVAPLSAVLPRLEQKSSSFQDCSSCPWMETIEGGTFKMGSPPEEAGREPSEAPLHEVKILNPFAIGRFKVSFEEWDKCVADGGCNGYRPDDDGWGRGGQPVISVSWEDARAYTDWLAKKTSKHYRLPSEAEWEYAARARTWGPFSFKGKISPDKANYRATETYDGSAPGIYRGRTVPVTMFQPNAFGLYQVHGNVWEWMEDCWSGSYASAPTGGAPNEHGDCEKRVIRGGGWADPPEMLRSARRGLGLPGNRNNRRGFRVARDL